MKRLVKVKWKMYETRWVWRNFYYHKILRRHIFEKYFHLDLQLPFYAHKWLLSGKKCNDWIADKIRSKEAFMVSRFGNTELQIAVCIHRERLLGETKRNQERFTLYLEKHGPNAGLFPINRELAYEFTDLLIEACKQTDLLATFYCYMDDFMITEYLPEAKLTYLSSIEPFRGRGSKYFLLTLRREYIKGRSARRSNAKFIPECFQTIDDMIVLKDIKIPIPNAKDMRVLNINF